MPTRSPSAPTIPRVDVLGVHVSAGDIPRSVEAIAGFIEHQDRTYVCITGVHGVIESQSDPELLAIHNASGLTTTDGMPLVWCAKRAGVADVERVYGPDLMLAVCEEGARQGWSMYYYGAAEGVPQRLAETLEARFPGLKTAGTFSPPFRALSEVEDREICEQINASGADIVWVGLSTPKQERWMAAHRDLLDAPVLVGVGAAFDFHTGNVRQAPGWLQRSGLEWVFRLTMEPKRLWKRYGKIVPVFLVKIVRQRPTVVSEGRP